MFDADIIYDTSPHASPRPDERDAAILSARRAQRAALPPSIPQVGEWVREVDGRMSRITYIWELDEGAIHIQHGGSGSGSYYLLDSGHESYSGGLDPGFPGAELELTDETAPGQVWFFHHDFPGAHRGVYFMMPERVWNRRA